MKTKDSTLEEFFRSKIVPLDVLQLRLDQEKKSGKSIATLNGSFDLLHAGHLYILFEASQTADILVVALNTDDSIKRYKSPKRPIVPLQYRMKMIASLAFVDYVTFFDEDDPRKLLEQIKPNVHVNGAEYGSHCIEAETVKNIQARLHLVPKIEGLSTSQLIQTIQNICAS